METKNLIFSAELPYPSVEVKEKNPFYGKAMLDNVGGINSEMTAVSFYFYNNLIASSYADIAYIFQKINMVEMHHLFIFGTLACQLGENPRLWSYRNRKPVFWSPAYNKYPTKLNTILESAILAETTTIEKYANQAKQIKDDIIVANLERIILDEKIHKEILQKLYQEYCQ